jgi:L-ascorbate metabolism protein UlaG (beta-lactamase superfamily)
MGADIGSRQHAGGSKHRARLKAVCSAAAAFFFLPQIAFGFCHQVEVARRIAASGDAGKVSIEWFGHSTFQLTSAKGTRIVTDPHARDDLPWPSLPPHIVTTSHRHGPHSAVWMVRGKPVVLEGLTPGGDNWTPIYTSLRDISVYTVPAYHDKSHGLQRGKNAIFVFRIDGMCIAHLGDLGHALTPPQLKMMGKIDVLLVPIAGGMYTVTAAEAREVTKQVSPKIAIPKHYWWDGAVEEYVADHPRVRRLSGRTLRVSKAELPQPIEIVVLSWQAP